VTAEPRQNGEAREQGRRRGSVLVRLAVAVRRSRWRAWIPRWARSAGYALLPGRELDRRSWRADYERLMNGTTRVPIRTDVKLGIIRDVAYKHGHYEAACRELGVPYELVDITGSDWTGQIEGCDCRAFLVWPVNLNSVRKRMYDERLRILTEEMGKFLFPSYEALWLYESKRRTADWLKVNGLPHPETHVFFDRERALSFLADAELPLVFKTDLGSTASGVHILRDRKRARRLVKKCFGKGYLGRRHDRRDRDWGYVLLQQYVPDATEWRMVCMGDSYFGHRKLRRGDFHSGSREVGWVRPPDRLLDFVRAVTDCGPFLSMNVDVLERPDGEYLVNELHPVFGSKNPEQMILDGRPGRFVHVAEQKTWRFEEGDFCRNVLCNERVKTVLRLLGRPLPEDVDAPVEALPAKGGGH